MIQGRNINLDVKRIVAYRQFCNKIWNSFKLSIGKLDYAITYDQNSLIFEKLCFINQWILVKLNNCINIVNESFKNYEFGEAANKFYSFWYYEFCDVYLEAIKTTLYEGNKEDLHIVNTILYYI